MPRTYNATAILPPTPPPLRVLKPEAGIPKNATLMSVRNASTYLNKCLDGGYSVSRIYQLISTKQWVEGIHYARDGKGKKARIKVCVDAVVEWVVTPNSAG